MPQTRLFRLGPLSFLLLLFSVPPNSSSPTFAWLSNQLQQIQNLTSSLIPRQPQSTTTRSILISTPRPPRYCKLLQGCLNATDCIDTGPETEIVTASTPPGLSKYLLCPPTAPQQGECWWDTPGCMITKRVPPCACPNTIK